MFSKIPESDVDALGVSRLLSRACDYRISRGSRGFLTEGPGWQGWVGSLSAVKSGAETGGHRDQGLRPSGGTGTVGQLWNRVQTKDMETHTMPRLKNTLA